MTLQDTSPPSSWMPQFPCFNTLSPNYRSVMWWVDWTWASPRHTSSSLAGNDWLSLLYNKWREKKEGLRRRRDRDFYPMSHILTPGVASPWTVWGPGRRGQGVGGRGCPKSVVQTKCLLLQHEINLCPPGSEQQSKSRVICSYSFMH